MGRTKLTRHDVILMRLLYAGFPGLKICNLGDLFGVEPATVGCVVYRKTWRHLPDQEAIMKIVDFHIDGSVVVHRGSVSRRYCPRTYSLHRVIKLIDRWKHIPAMGIEGGFLVRAMPEYPTLSQRQS